MKSMIGIFVLLIISMIVVGKYCKKKPLKIGLAIVISLVTLYCVMVSIDMSRVNTFRKPIFMWEIQNKCAGQCSSYLGLGYQVDIKYYDNGIIETIEMYMFGKVIAGGVQDIENPSKSDTIINEDGLVIMSVNEESTTNSKAIFTLVNNTNETYIYGNPYSIEYEKDGIWYDLKPINDLNFDDIAYYLEAKDSIKMEIDWEWHYGKLKTGKYRVIKTVFREADVPIELSDEVYIGAEFIIK